MRHFKITFGIRDGDNEYTEAWVMDNPCAGFFEELLPDSDPDKLTDMDIKFLLNHYFGEGLSLGEDDEGNESLEATKEEHRGCYWLAGGERLAWIDGIEEIPLLPLNPPVPLGHTNPYEDQCIKVWDYSQDHVDLYEDFVAVLSQFGVEVERDDEAEEREDCDMVILISKKENDQ